MKFVKIRSKKEFNKFSKLAIKNKKNNIIKSEKANPYNEVDYNIVEKYNRIFYKEQNTPNQRLSFIKDQFSYTVGYVWLERIHPSSFKLNYIYIFPFFRGNGYAKKALSYIYKLARKAQISIISLYVFRKNRIAIHLYEDFGFIKVSHYLDNRYYYELNVSI